MVIILLQAIKLKATPNGNLTNDLYGKQKSGSPNAMQCNTTNRGIILH